MNKIPNLLRNNILRSALITTPLGSMLAIADEKFLYILEFADQKNLDKKIKNLEENMKATIASGNNHIIDSIKKELELYFAGKLTKFKTPIYIIGSDFKIKVWQELQKIPFGQTKSYLDIASLINKPKHFRPVAQANASNILSIIIPCHRVINKNKKLGGYGGGLERKEWLLNHESNNLKINN